MVGILCLLWLAASIEGQLTNALTGAPVRKADVAVGTVEGTVVKRVLSDANGHYVAAGLADGRYRVAAARAGYLPALVGAVILVKGNERKQVNIALETPAVIAGRVVDEEQDPVEGVGVAAIMKDAGSGAVRFAGKAKTNDKGEYRFAGLAAGAYVIRAARAAAPLGEVYQPAFYPAAAEWESASPVRVAAGAEARDIDLVFRKGKAGSLAGVVHGEGVEPVRVRVSRKAADAVMLTVTEGEGAASPDGRFLFANLPAGAYVVMAEAKRRDGHLLWASAEANVNGAAVQTELTLQPARELAVTVNEPVRAVLMRGDRYRSEARTVEGKLVFQNVMPGTWTLQLEPVAPDAYVEAVQLGGREISGQPLELGPDVWPALRVIVHQRGGTLEGEGGSATLIPEGRGKALEASAGRDGRYKIRGIRPGKYRLACSGEVLEVVAGALLKRDCQP